MENTLFVIDGLRTSAHPIVLFKNLAKQTTEK